MLDVHDDRSGASPICPADPASNLHVPTIGWGYGIVKVKNVASPSTIVSATVGHVNRIV